MRVSSLALVTFGLLSGGAALAEATFAESSATLALTLTHPGTLTTRDIKGGDTLVSRELTRMRLGNKQILETLVARELIPSIQGWSIVALWAEWPDAEPYAGNAYRFFARRGKGASTESVAIPRDVLSVEPLSGAIAYRHRVTGGDTLATGTETFSVYHQAVFSTTTQSGLSQGLEIGTGRYIKQKDTPAGRYLPNASKLTLQGVFDALDESTQGVVQGTVSYRAAKLVPASIYQTATASAASAGIIKIGSGTLTLGGDNTYTGGTSIIDGILAPVGGTGSIGGTTTIDLGSGVFAPGENFDLLTLNGEDFLHTTPIPFQFNSDGSLTISTPPAP